MGTLQMIDQRKAVRRTKEDLIQYEGTWRKEEVRKQSPSRPGLLPLQEGQGG